jgi:hypothetical protein
MKREIKKILKAQKQEIMPGKFINAPMPANGVEDDQTSPFILLHHFGPLKVNYLDKFAFEPHPHRGFDAVTILFEGEMQHRDTTGDHGRLSGGDVQWMSSGAGILHEESQPQDFLEKGGVLNGIQLWVNVPSKDKKTPAKYQDISKDSIPVIETGGVKERLIAGNYKNSTGPAKTSTILTAVHGIMSAGSEVNIEATEGYTMLIYITKGEVTVNESSGIVKAGEITLFENTGNELSLSAKTETEYLMLTGEPINEPVVQYGPFVMNTMGEIKQAFLDYREGKFGELN